MGLTEGLAFTFSNLGQQYTHTAQCALIMSMESVFAAISCYIFLGEMLSPLEVVGGTIMLFSTLLMSLETARAEEERLIGGNETYGDETSLGIINFDEIKTSAGSLEPWPSPCLPSL